MGDNSKWMEKVIDNRNILANLLISIICFLIGIALLASGLVKYFPPINPYGYLLSDSAGNIAIVIGCILVVLSVILYALGTRNTQESAQQIRTGVSYSDLRQYLLARVDAKFDIVNKLDVLPTPKSVANISYLLSETNSELSLLRCLRPHVLLLLEEEADDRVATEIVEIIGKTKVPNTEKVLIECYRRDYLDLKIACIIALGELGTIKSRKAIEKLLDTPQKVDGRLLSAMNVSLRKLVIPYEYAMALKNQLFDERIPKNIRETYIQSALEDLGTEEAINATKAYQLSKMEGVDVNSAYEQIMSKTREDAKK
jgi:HEAT repeat protein